MQFDILNDAMGLFVDANGFIIDVNGSIFDVISIDFDVIGWKVDVYAKFKIVKSPCYGLNRTYLLY